MSILTHAVKDRITANDYLITCNGLPYRVTRYAGMSWDIFHGAERGSNAPLLATNIETLEEAIESIERVARNIAYSRKNR